MEQNNFILGTKKGLLYYVMSEGKYVLKSNHFEGIPVTAFLNDNRTGVWWVALNHGHWGVKLHKSVDEGQTWEAVDVPSFQEGKEYKAGVPATVKDIFCIQQGGEDEKDTLWIGTRPGALFKSEDYGKTFQLNHALWDLPSRTNPNQWFGGGWDEPIIHSIELHPNNKDHIYLGLSVAGVFETKDGGSSWSAINKGSIAGFLPDPNVELGHDPHRLLICKNNPNVLWQQNHCGVFKTENSGQNWIPSSKEEEVAHFGFALAIDHDNHNEAWIIPAISDEIRIANDQKLRVYYTNDSGENWTSRSNGLPQQNSFDLVYRHAFDKQNNTLAFGTTTGNLYLSKDKGLNWMTVSNNIPPVNVLHFI